MILVFSQFMVMGPEINMVVLRYYLIILSKGET